jgi:pilus assembly protein TadC
MSFEFIVYTVYKQILLFLRELLYETFINRSLPFPLITFVTGTAANAMMAAG